MVLSCRWTNLNLISISSKNDVIPFGTLYTIYFGKTILTKNKVTMILFKNLSESLEKWEISEKQWNTILTKKKVIYDSFKNLSESLEKWEISEKHIPFLFTTD